MKRITFAPLLTLGLLLCSLLGYPLLSSATSVMDSAPTQALRSQECLIKLTTTKAVGEKIKMKLRSKTNRASDISVEGIKETPQVGNKSVEYTLTSQTIVLRGWISSFECSNAQITKAELLQCPTLESFALGNNLLTELDLSQCKHLDNFNCYKNKLTELDLTGLADLNWFNCYENQLTKLDLTSTPLVSAIRCNDNQLTEIIIPADASLSAINCSNNKLSHIDLSGASKLRSLTCSNNMLTELDLSSCPWIDKLTMDNNQVKGAAMTKLVQSLPDLSNKKYSKGQLKVHFNPTTRPSEGNVCLKSDVAIAKAKNWVVAYTDEACKGSTYEGEETPLEGLITLTSERAIGLKIGLYIEASGEVRIAGVEEPVEVGKYKNYTLTSQSLDITGHITKLRCASNQLSAIVLTDCPELQELECFNNNLLALDLSHAPKLQKLIGYINKIAEIDFSHCPELTQIDLQSNGLDAIDLSPLRSLKKLNCSANALTALDLTSCAQLERLDCFSNALTELRLPRTATLSWVNCGDNRLTSLDISDCSSLQTLSCYKNQIWGAAMTQLVQALPDRTGLETAGLFGVHFDATALDDDGNVCLQSDVVIAMSKNWNVRAVDKGADYLGEAAGVIKIVPNEGVEELSLSIKGTNGSITISGVMEEPILGEKTTYTLYGNAITIRGDVTALDCSSTKLCRLTIIGCDNLGSLACYSNSLTSLSLYKCPKLTSISCHTNKIEQLDLEECPALATLDCSSNKIHGAAMTQLMKSLPDRTGMTQGSFTVHLSRDEIDFDGNVCYDTDVAIAKGKNWKVGFVMSKDEYEGKDDPQAKIATVTMSTERAIGDQLSLMIKATGEVSITGVSEEPLLGKYKKYTLTSQTVTIKGRIQQLACWGNELKDLKLENCQELTVLGCSSNKLTHLDLAQCPNLFLLGCANNQIKGSEMTALVKSLPDRNQTETGTFQVHKSPEAIILDGNVCLKSDVTLAVSKNWRTVFAQTNQEYPGAETAPVYAVTLNVGSGGQAQISGVADLTAVPKGTKLTISATPDKGYELEQLLANDLDCTESMTFVVTAPTIVKVTFKKINAISSVTEATTRLYPNPATDLLSIEGAKPHATLSLYDSRGACILQTQLDPEGQATISVAHLPAGLYLLLLDNQCMPLVIAH